MQGQHDSSIKPPAGYRFCPTDVELARYYLYGKVKGNIPLPNVVKDCNLYGDHEPWEIWEAFGGSKLTVNEEDLFFYTQLNNRSANDSRSKRRVGRTGGTWKGENKFGPYTSNNITWTMTTFSYKNPNYSKQDDGCSWILHQYSLDESLLSNPSNYVLCRLRKKVSKKTEGTNVSHNLNAIDQSLRSDQPVSVAVEKHHQSKRLKLEPPQPHDQQICNFNQQPKATLPPETDGISVLFAQTSQDKAEDLMAFCSTSFDDALIQDDWIEQCLVDDDELLGEGKYQSPLREALPKRML